MIQAIWSVNEARMADAHTLQTGMPLAALLSNAGQQLARYLEQVIPTGRVLIMTGPGANGADGWIAARYLARHHEVTVVPVAEPAFDGASDWVRATRAAGASIYEGSPTKELLNSVSGIVDAIYGTGLNRSIRGSKAYTWLKWASDFIGPVVAVDVLTGLDANTGNYSGPDIRVHSSFAMGQAKWGHVGYPGASVSGELVVADIGLMSPKPPETTWVTPDLAQKLFPQVESLSHKYGRGHVVVIGGSRAMPGAPILAATAALHAGAGLVEIVIPESARGLVSMPAALLAHSAPETANGDLVMSDMLMARARKADAIVFGPGMGERVPLTLLGRLFDLKKPMVIDADGIRLARHAISRFRSGGAVLTPHAGELGSLLQCSADTINRDRRHAVQRAVQLLGTPLLLKGRYTVIGSQDHLWVNPTGSAALATAGSGDVLSGIVGRLLAAGLDGPEALSLGAYWHGFAGDIGQQHLGYSLTSMDLIDCLPIAAKAIENGEAGHGGPKLWI